MHGRWRRCHSSVAGGAALRMAPSRAEGVRRQWALADSRLNRRRSFRGRWTPDSHRDLMRARAAAVNSASFAEELNAGPSQASRATAAEEPRHGRLGLNRPSAGGHCR